ncbi:hypothetical protein K438DRAFT_1867698 [Mycena galopus ATCC 62051]|nr:hypothetical protein K438DRAFT_1867698 [Mycena galopus ATCC 62051]
MFWGVLDLKKPISDNPRHIRVKKKMRYIKRPLTDWNAGACSKSGNKSPLQPVRQKRLEGVP